MRNIYGATVVLKTGLAALINTIQADPTQWIVAIFEVDQANVIVIQKQVN